MAGYTGSRKLREKKFSKCFEEEVVNYTEYCWKAETDEEVEKITGFGNKKVTPYKPWVKRMNRLVKAVASSWAAKEHDGRKVEWWKGKRRKYIENLATASDLADLILDKLSYQNY